MGKNTSALMKDKKPNSIVNSKRSQYLSDPNVQKYNKSISNRLFNKKGRPYAFESVEQLTNDIGEYLALCYDTNTIPTIMGLSVWVGCSRETIYAHSVDKSSPFSDVLSNFINLTHLSLEDSAIAGSTNSVLYIYLSKNYYGLKDQQDITLSPKNSDTQPNTIESYDAIKEQLSTEHTKQLIEHSEE